MVCRQFIFSLFLYPFSFSPQTLNEYLKEEKYVIRSNKKEPENDNGHTMLNVEEITEQRDRRVEQNLVLDGTVK